MAPPKPPPPPDDVGEEFDLEEADDSLPPPHPAAAPKKPPKPPPPKEADVGEEFDLVEADDSIPPPPRPPSKQKEEGGKKDKGKDKKERADEWVLDLPKPPAKSDPGVGEEFDELAQVERAMASLEGRNIELAADLAVQRRDAEERRHKIEDAFEGVDERVRAERIRKGIKIGITAIVVIGLAIAAIRIVPMMQERQAQQEAAANAADEAAKPFAARGFKKDSVAVSDDERAFTTGADRCYIVVAASTSGSPSIRISGGVLPTEGRGSVGFCACGEGKVNVEAAGDGHIATAVLSAPTSAIGGTERLAVAPAPTTIADQPDKSCEQAHIDAYIQAGHEQPAPEELTSDEKLIASEHLTAVTHGGEAEPWVSIPDGEGTCFLAVSRQSGDRLSLRLPGGERPVEASTAPLIGCAAKAGGLTVWRAGRGAVTVFTAPAAKVGGMMGMLEAADRLGLETTPWLASEDRADDAKNALVASAIPADKLIPDLNGKDRAQASLFALSTDERTSLAPHADDPELLCVPALKQKARHTMCVHAKPGGWSLVKKFPKGTVGGPRPFWLVAPPAADPAALQRDLDVLSLARRLSLAGFKLTTSTNVKVLPNGVEVSGRSGENDVVAIVVSATQPFVHTLSSGEPWKLQDKPAIVELPTGKSELLTATPPFSPGGLKEALVWRR